MNQRGNPRLDAVRADAVAAAKAKAAKFARDIEPTVIGIMRRYQTTSAKRIAAILAAQRVPTARGGKWTAVQAGALLRRIDPDGSKRAAVPSTPRWMR